MSALFALLASFATSLVAVAILLSTRNLHGHLSLDSAVGVQKVHDSPTPRIGGLAIALGCVLGGVVLPASAQALWWVLCLSAFPAFAAGLCEDITKRVGAKWRLVATILAGLIFCVATDYRIARVDLPVADWLLSFDGFAIVFTAVAIGGIANALNLIDGVNGLASGSSIIILSGFAVIAESVGDTEVLGFCLLMIGALGGFFLFNFPLGRIFLGDAGAYSTGFMLAVVAVMLPMRHPGLSPLFGLLALSYPVIETMVSIHRRIVRDGTHPGQPDRLHLHSLVYRHRARRLARVFNAPQYRNAMTSVILWGMPLLSTLLSVLYCRNTVLVVLGLAVELAAYMLLYRRVALLRPWRHRPRPVKAALSRDYAAR